MGVKAEKTLVLATSYAPEPGSSAFPRTDYVELSKILDCDIIDYAAYDEPGLHRLFRPCEKKLRIDFHLALMGYRRSALYGTVLLMSERVALPYLFLCKLFGKRTRSLMISMHSSRKQARVFRSLNLSNQLDGVISFTPAQRYFLTDEMKLPPSVISYIPYCVDTEFFTPDSPRNDGYVMSAGGVPGRDYGTFLEAVSEIDCEVRIVCGGRAYGRRTSGGLRVSSDRIKVISNIPSTSMRDVYRNAALVVVPLAEGRDDAAGSTVLLEAMSAAKCVVVSSSPGIKPYIATNDIAVFVPPGRADLLRDAIVQLLQNSEERELRGGKARAFVRDNCDVTHYARRLARVVKGEVLEWPWQPGLQNSEKENSEGEH